MRVNQLKNHHVLQFRRKFTDLPIVPKGSLDNYSKTSSRNEFRGSMTFIVFEKLQSLVLF